MNTSDSMTSISSAVSVVTDDDDDDLITPCLTRLPPSPPRKSSEKHHSGRGHLGNTHLASSSATPAIAPRMSMEEYYTRPKSILVPPVPILLQPPPYDLSIADVKPISPRRIQPREEEGREKLPPYTCPISIRAVFLKKLELDNAVQRARDRKWYRVMVELRGTALSIWGVRRRWLGEDEMEDTGDHIGKGKGTETKRNPDLPRGVKRGELLRRYSLQHAEVGIAQDYLKYDFSYPFYFAFLHHRLLRQGRSTNLSLDADMSSVSASKPNNFSFPAPLSPHISFGSSPSHPQSPSPHRSKTACCQKTPVSLASCEAADAEQQQRDSPDNLASSKSTQA
jgi:hypothetical protein